MGGWGLGLMAQAHLQRSHQKLYAELSCPPAAGGLSLCLRRQMQQARPCVPRQL